MNILVTNDDGIFAEGLWALVKELKDIARVIVVAPDRERSAIGTAVTLHQPLRVQRVKPLVPEVDTYSVDGTPADCVILGLGKLVRDKIDLVVSGINWGANLGYDVLISGTVGGALQGYLRGLPALAISVIVDDDRLHFDGAAKLAKLLALKIGSGVLPADIFLNVNLPNLPLAQIGGIEITRVASETHTNTVDERHEGRSKYYWLIREKTSGNTEPKTDVWAVDNGNISITPLHNIVSNKLSPRIPKSLPSELIQELRSYQQH